MATLEQELEKALLERYKLWKDIRYTAKYFKRMLTPSDRIYKGAVETVKHLMGKKLTEKSGFERLKKAGRLEWTVEALLADEKWHPLFEDWELERARQRVRGLKSQAHRCFKKKSTGGGQRARRAGGQTRKNRPCRKRTTEWIRFTPIVPRGRSFSQEISPAPSAGTQS
jgi:hypothetical protein